MDETQASRESLQASTARVGVVVASCGRPEELKQLLIALSRQTRRPSRIVLSLHTAADAPADPGPGVEIVFGSKGLPAQRNRGLACVEHDVDLVAFLDDDYLPARTMIAGAAALFERYPDVVACNGRLLADGINSAGIDYPAALALIDRFEREGRDEVNIRSELDGLYGCNMVYRASALQGARFDENLPLYGWQEDIDFAARLLPLGRLIRSDAFAGVHRGVKGGRTSGVKLGYSQVVNPIYLARKRTMNWRYARKLIRNNLFANVGRFFFPEPWVDRRGRLHGNLLGFFDVIRGKDDPRNILELN